MDSLNYYFNNSPYPLMSFIDHLVAVHILKYVNYTSMIPPVHYICYFSHYAFFGWATNLMHRKTLDISVHQAW